MMTPRLQQKVEAALASQVGFAVVYKGGPLWNIVAMALDALRLAFGLNIVPGAEFISAFATTVLAMVALPSVEMTPLERVLLMVHEATHVKQWYGDIVKFPVWYLQHGEKRASYEAGAILQAYAVYWALTGRIPTSPKELPSAIVNGYALTDADVKLAESLLEQEVTALLDGILPSGPCRIALQVIYEDSPHEFAPGSLAKIRENSGLFLAA